MVESALELHLIGHASWLARSASTAVLFDPVFTDPFEDGAVLSCPKREANVDACAEADAIVITHAHPDHFDLHSLARLPRSTPIIVPEDTNVSSALAGMGFAERICIKAHERIMVGDIELFPTPSLFTDCVEHGFMVRSGGVSVWNQVDSLVDAAAVNDLIRRYGPIDVHLAWYACQNFAFFDDRSTAFPAEGHLQNIANAIAVGARLVVPSSSGFRFAEPHDWLNPFLFPVSRERFARDLKAVSPEAFVLHADPGDVVACRPNEVPEIIRSANLFASTVATDLSHIAFDPSRGVPTLSDPNLPGLPEETLRSFACAMLKRAESLSSDSEDVQALKKARVRYRLEFVLPSGDIVRRVYLFSPEGIVASSEHDDFDMSLSLAASVAFQFVEHRVSWFLLRAYRRITNSALAISTRDDALHCSPVPFVDLLSKLT